jgi:hypothetical protein
MFALAEIHLDYDAIKSGDNWHKSILLVIGDCPIGLGFSVFARPEMLEQVTVKAGSDQGSTDIFL